MKGYNFFKWNITNYYGNLKGCEVVQIELWYQKYIDERKFGNKELPAINNSI